MYVLRSILILFLQYALSTMPYVLLNRLLKNNF